MRLRFFLGWKKKKLQIEKFKRFVERKLAKICAFAKSSTWAKLTRTRIWASWGNTDLWYWVGSLMTTQAFWPLPYGLCVVLRLRLNFRWVIQHSHTSTLILVFCLRDLGQNAACAAWSGCFFTLLLAVWDPEQNKQAKYVKEDMTNKNVIISMRIICFFVIPTIAWCWGSR